MLLVRWLGMLSGQEPNSRGSANCDFGGGYAIAVSTHETVRIAQCKLVGLLPWFQNLQLGVAGQAVQQHGRGVKLLRPVWTFEQDMGGFG